MPQPNKIPRPFADSGDKNSIPESSGALGFASWQEGFPAITGTPFAQGGVAPKRADFNGIFNALSLATLWQQQGGFYAYDTTTDYEIGNVVEYNNDLYKCLSANGPSSAVKAPTDTTVWSKVMTAADAAALYLPLSGGAMSGSITKNTSDNYFYISGGLGWDLAQNGARIALYGKDHTSLPGVFRLSAGSSVGTPELLGKPDGTLTWDGKNVVTVEKGTWTPTVDGSLTAGATTITANSSFYQKFGDLVFARAYFKFTITSPPTGEVQIGGLPYIPDYFYWGVLATNANAGIIANMHSGGWVRPMAYNTTTGMGTICSWGSTAAYNVWPNTVNKNVNVLFQIWYRTSA